MSKSSRLLAHVALSLTLVTLVARGSAAQTVIVRHVPAGSTVEAQLNTAPAQTAAADAAGNAELTVKLPAGTAEGVVRVFVDKCVSRVAVRLATPGTTPPPAGGDCTRSDVGAQFVIRPETSFVVDADAASARVRQGPVPPGWLNDAILEGAAAGLVVPRAGLMLFGGGGLTSYRRAIDVACGDVSCAGSDIRLGMEGGATFWVTPFLGAQVTLVKPLAVKASGAGTTYGFESSLASRLLVVAANVGAPVGRVRLYGQAGANVHQATFTQTEMIDDKTITVDGAAQTIPGGTQTSVLETRGWGWVFGGGLEGWAANAVAIYAEGRYAHLHGRDVGGGEGQLDDHLFLAMAGVRVRLGF